MYCKACGKKIIPGTDNCPHCGRPVDVVSGGTGFWDIHEPNNKSNSQVARPSDRSQKSVHAVNSTNVAREPVTAKPTRAVTVNNWSKSRIIRCIIAGIIVIILLITHIITLTSNGKLRKDIAALETKLRMLDERLLVIEEQTEVKPEPTMASEEPSIPTTYLPFLSPEPSPSGVLGSSEPTGGDIEPKLNLRIEGANQDENGIYIISEDASVIWDDIAASGYYLTIMGEDETPITIDNRVLADIEMTGNRQQLIEAQRMHESIVYIIKIEAKDTDGNVTQQDTISLKLQVG